MSKRYIIVGKTRFIDMVFEVKADAVDILEKLRNQHPLEQYEIIATDNFAKNQGIPARNN